MEPKRPTRNNKGRSTNLLHMFMKTLRLLWQNQREELPSVELEEPPASLLKEEVHLGPVLEQDGLSRIDSTGDHNPAPRPDDRKQANEKRRPPVRDSEILHQMEADEEKQEEAPEHSEEESYAPENEQFQQLIGDVEDADVSRGHEMEIPWHKGAGEPLADPTAEDVHQVDSLMEPSSKEELRSSDQLVKLSDQADVDQEERPLMFKEASAAMVPTQEMKLNLPSCFQSSVPDKQKPDDPSDLQDLCSGQGGAMKMLDCTDPRLLRYLSSMEDLDQGAVSSAERAWRQKELEASRQTIQERIQAVEEDVKDLQQEVAAINISADKAVEESTKIFTQLISLMEKRCSDVEQQIRFQQESEVSRVTELQEKLEQEITELKRRDAELSNADEDLLSSQGCPSPSRHSSSPPAFCGDDGSESYSEHEGPQLESDQEEVYQEHCLEQQEVSRSPSTGDPNTDDRSQADEEQSHLVPMLALQPCQATGEELGRDSKCSAMDSLSTEEGGLSRNRGRGNWTKTEVEASLLDPTLETRADFLKYSCDITLDPSTADPLLALSRGNRKATFPTESYSSQGSRLLGWTGQVLSRESLTGRCYWEVEWTGSGGVCVAVATKSMSRAHHDSVFGWNDQSWALHCFKNSYTYQYNKVPCPLRGPPSSRVGVFLDHGAGVLSFYSVSGTMTLLHRVQTSFTQPLCAGLHLYFYSPGDTAEFVRLQ